MLFIKIRVLFFAAAKDKVGCDYLELQLQESACLSDLMNQLWKNYPQLTPLQPYIRWAVNHQFEENKQRELNHGDEVALIPPISGG
jgi:molybdopterin converting factor subunit 1